MDPYLQAGALGVLLATLVGVYRLVFATMRAVLPVARDLARVLARIDQGLSEVLIRVEALDGRGVCPLLERRELIDGAPPTEPEVR